MLILNTALRNAFDVLFVNNRPIVYFMIQINNSFFPNGVRPIDQYFNDGSYAFDGLCVYFHYPGQFFTSEYTIKYNWDPILNKTRQPMMSFTVTGVEVIKQRNKPDKICFEDWRNYDEYLRDAVMSEVGCKPPHWKTSKNMRLCSLKQQMEKFNMRNIRKKVSSFPQPCNSIHVILYKYAETEWDVSFAGTVNY